MGDPDGVMLRPMRRILIAAGALITAGAIAFALARPEPKGHPTAPPSVASTAGRTEEPKPAVSTAAARPAAPTAAPPAASAAAAVPSESGSTPSNDLLALEDQALRRIDIAPVLESSGVDLGALTEQADGEDVLRHAAADELLTRAFMRDLFSLTVYPTGYPEAHALSEARDVAQGIIATLSPVARANALQRALAGSSDVPVPFFYPAGSGHDFDGHLRSELPPRN